MPRHEQKPSTKRIRARSEQVARVNSILVGKKEIIAEAARLIRPEEGLLVLSETHDVISGRESIFIGIHPEDVQSMIKTLKTMHPCTWVMFLVRLVRGGVTRICLHRGFLSQ